MSRGSVFLGGDAAHIQSPGARGMNPGIEDASWLAYLIAEGRELEYAATRIPVVRPVPRQTRARTVLTAVTAPLALAARRVAAPVFVRFRPVKSAQLRAVAGYDTPKRPWIDWPERLGRET